MNEIIASIRALPPSQRHGLITLACKDQLLTNWRPISLLDVDYEILSKFIKLNWCDKLRFLHLYLLFYYEF